MQPLEDRRSKKGLVVSPNYSRSVSEKVEPLRDLLRL